MGFLGLNRVLGVQWFAEVQSGSQGFFEVHLGFVRFDVVLGVKWVQCGLLRFSVVCRGSLRFIWVL